MGNGKELMGIRESCCACRRSLIGAAVAMTAVFAACDNSPIEPWGPGPFEIVDGVQYRVKDLRILESFPVQIGVTVELQNLSSAPRYVVFPDGCAVLMRAYADGNDPVWDMGTGRACTMALVEVRLEVGEIREVQSEFVSATAILEGGLEARDYLISAYLRVTQNVSRSDSGSVVDIVEILAGNVALASP